MIFKNNSRGNTLGCSFTKTIKEVPVMIVIHAYMKVSEEHRKTFLEQAKQVITHSKAETENMSYHLYEDTEGSHTFVFLEVWKDEAAIEKHEATAHFKSFIKEIPSLLLEPIRIEKYQAVEKK
jgi:quinol monooxygenase YgiN